LAADGLRLARCGLTTRYRPSTFYIRVGGLGGEGGGELAALGGEVWDPRRVASAGTYDVIVVGGRVAGCLTAAHLEADGASVAVVEAAVFPSDTMSTHYFRGYGLGRSLAEVGVLDDLLAEGAPPYRHELWYDNGDEPVSEGPQEPGEVGFSLSVRRITLDAILAARVGSLAGVDLLTGVRVVDLLHDGGQVAGVTTADGRELRAPVVVGADGRRSPVARRVAADVQHHHEPTRVIYYRYLSGWRGVDDAAADAPEFSLVGDELAYVFPSDNDVTCVAVSLPIALWSTTAAARAAQFDERLRDHRGLAARLQATTPVSGVIAAPPSPSEVLAASGPGWALVGDAGTHQDPWSGEGMDTAALQARELGAALAGGAGWEARYQRGRDDVTLDTFHETVTGMQDLSSLFDSDAV
jgi:flavin-dependent dehydrogenase